MREHDEPIVDLKGAEAFFRAMECSTYLMSRECLVRAAEYRALGISSELERQWTVSEFRKLRREIEDGTVSSDDLGIVHARIANMIWQRREIETVTALLRELLTVTHSIRDRVPDAWRIIVAETIVGRGPMGSVDGSMPRAMELGMRAEASAFAELARAFADGTRELESATPLRQRKAYVLKRVAALEAGLDGTQDRRPGLDQPSAGPW